MLLALLALALLAAVLILPTVVAAVRRRAGGRRKDRTRPEGIRFRDPGRERRAEQRARELLRSCVNAEEWAMYRDLGFIRVLGRAGRPADRPSRRFAGAGPDGAGDSGDTGELAIAGRQAAGAEDAPYAYLIYPHKPIVAYVPKTRRLLSEYCVEFPDLSAAVTGSKLPDSDDVLAKWMALTGDERRLIRNANMPLPGRQVDPGRVRRDLWRLAEWERRRRGSAQAPRT